MLLIPIIGTELKLADGVCLDMQAICRDISQDLVDYDPDVAAMVKERSSRSPVADLLAAPSNVVVVLDVDEPVSRIPEQPNVIMVDSEDPGTDAERLVHAIREQRLFPNSFKVSGLKHISDNLTGSVLQALPQHL